LYDSAAKPASPANVSLANFEQELPARHSHTTMEVICGSREIEVVSKK
jgi:hypothetical protein